VAVADVPGEAQEMGGVIGFDGVEDFLRGEDFEQAAVIELQRAFVVKGDSIGEIDEDFGAVLAGQQLSAEAPFVMGKGDAVYGGATAMMGGQMGDGTKHGGGESLNHCVT
jgi:hypothetical protein